MRLTRSRNDQGVALITVIMMLTLISAMLVATTALVVKDQRARFQDHNRTETFYVAHAGLEKITNDLGRAFTLNYAPSQADLNRVTANPPTLGGMTFEIPGGGERSGYKITKGIESPPQVITTGDYAGLRGMITPYTIDVTAQSPQKSEVSLRRTVNTIAIPVFQFGIFSETDLSFFPGPNFNFGGRVHTNGNLFLAKDDNGNQLILGDYVAAFGDVIRHEMANGRSTVTANYDGIVKIATANNGCNEWDADTCLQIDLDQGSKIDDATYNLDWETISTSDFNHYITNGANGDAPNVRPDGARATGAKRLLLPITSGGAPAISLIRRPAENEHNANPQLFEQRFYSMASIRILLSDTQAELDNLAGKGPGNAQNLQAAPWNTNTARAGVGVPNPLPLNPWPNRPWVAGGGPPPTTAGWPYTVKSGEALVGGWIKIEMQNQAGGTWTDITTEILNRGFWGPSLVPAVGQPNHCAGDPDAVIRFQRFRDGVANWPNNCDATVRENFWSNTLYDAREGAVRDNNATAGSRIYAGGIMHYVELDIANLRTYLASKRLNNDIMETTGYVVYFSDRRGNKDLLGNETGEYGYEDIVHQNVANPVLETGEDVNGNGTLQTYGALSRGVVAGDGSRAPFHATGLVTDWFETIDPGAAGAAGGLYPAEWVARASRPVFFRRALKLVNGNRLNMRIDTAGLTPHGLTVVAENPVYIHGDYNATTSDGVTAEGTPATYDNLHVACAVIADAVTLLSNAWNDRTSFTSPHNPGARVGNTTTFRTAVISGKGLAFTWEEGMPRDFGTDGGTHNFLRYLEGGNRTLNYRGSIVSLYYNAQANGTYKCCNNVYGAPTRAFSFDTDFLNPALLPPRTPMFRAIDVTSFTRLSAPPDLP
jgi:hypothetical protein